MLATVAIAASISLAQAQSSPSSAVELGPVPVRISACEITRRARTRNTFNPYPLAVTGGLHVSFVDLRSVAASEVRFRVDYRGESEVVVDSGMFSPGATISHSFDNFSDYAYLGPRPNLCRVVSVRFADGSIWNGVPLRQTRRPL
jgi:hypothetical protein